MIGFPYWGVQLLLNASTHLPVASSRHQFLPVGMAESASCMIRAEAAPQKRMICSMKSSDVGHWVVPPNHGWEHTPKLTKIALHPTASFRSPNQNCLQPCLPCGFPLRGDKRPEHILHLQ